MKRYSKHEITQILSTPNDISEATDVLLYATFNVDDPDWVEAICLNLIDHTNENLSGLAITCLGHIARIHAKINKRKVIPILELKLMHPTLAGRAEDALEDIEMYAK